MEKKARDHKNLQFHHLHNEPDRQHLEQLLSESNHTPSQAFPVRKNGKKFLHLSDVSTITIMNNSVMYGVLTRKITT